MANCTPRSRGDRCRSERRKHASIKILPAMASGLCPCNVDLMHYLIICLTVRHNTYRLANSYSSGFHRLPPILRHRSICIRCLYLDNTHAHTARRPQRCCEYHPRGCRRSQQICRWCTSRTCSCTRSRLYPPPPPTMGERECYPWYTRRRPRLELSCGCIRRQCRQQPANGPTPQRASCWWTGSLPIRYPCVISCFIATGLFACKHGASDCQYRNPGSSAYSDARNREFGYDAWRHRCRERKFGSRRRVSRDLLKDLKVLISP